MNEPPRTCPTCGNDLSDHPYYQPAPGRSARAVRVIALWLLPVMGIIYLVQLFRVGIDMGFGTGHGYFAVLLIGGPSLVLYIFSRLLPQVRNVICLHCNWNQEFPL